MSSTIPTTSHKAKKPRINIKPPNEIILIDLTLDDDENIHTPLNSSNSTSPISTPFAPSKTISTRPTSSSSSTIRKTTLSLPPSPPQPLALTFTLSSTTPLELVYSSPPSFAFPPLQPLMGHPILYPLEPHSLSCACCHHNRNLIVNLRDDLGLMFSYLDRLLTPPQGPIIPPPPSSNSPSN